jgi:hypothetical protein
MILFSYFLLIMDQQHQKKELEAKHQELLQWRCKTKAEPFISWLVYSNDMKAADLVPDVNDDLKREFSFYQQALSAGQYAQEYYSSKNHKKDFFYFQELTAQDDDNIHNLSMLKDYKHMKKIQQRQESERETIKKRDEARKVRTQKKSAKKVQKESIKKKQEDRSEKNKFIKEQKRKRQSLSKQERDSFSDDEQDKRRKHERPKTSKFKSNKRQRS